MDNSLKYVAQIGLAHLAVGSLYAAYLSKPWYWFPLVLLGTGVVESEIMGALANSQMDFYKSEGDFVNDIKEQYAKAGMAKKMIDKVYKSDPEYAATKTWFEHHHDKIGRLGGSSIITNLLSGFAVDRFWLQGTWRRFGWFGLVLGLLAQWPTVDAIQAAYYSWGPESEAGVQVGHKYHLLGFMTGVVLSTWAL